MKIFFKTIFNFLLSIPRALMEGSIKNGSFSSIFDLFLNCFEAKRGQEIQKMNVYEAFLHPYFLQKPPSQTENALFALKCSIFQIFIASLPPIPSFYNLVKIGRNIKLKLAL